MVWESFQQLLKQSLQDQSNQVLALPQVLLSLAILLELPELSLLPVYLLFSLLEPSRSSQQVLQAELPSFLLQFLLTLILHIQSSFAATRFPDLNRHAMLQGLKISQETQHLIWLYSIVHKSTWAQTKLDLLLQLQVYCSKHGRPSISALLLSPEHHLLLDLQHLLQQHRQNLLAVKFMLLWNNQAFSLYLHFVSGTMLAYSVQTWCIANY